MNSMMLLTRAQALLTHNPFTLDDARSLEALEALEEAAVGEEGLLIAELWEAALMQADEAARHYMKGEG
ncbi:hypothetical protein FGF01_08190 [Aeromonas salmonicida subsp. achromogenes]|uniref:hypothetical protein n=1 Tax=Aeromonas salmonicida TaxID=645 RepID=UPI0002F18EDF|nr:hypothetical protein [Aeromonas salmonicida]TMX11397.1 hypothetical protein FGF01_08190 [Aeromonas salmonicida subsp. achromogenes]TMX14522.1 hypothetical protein FGE99_07960 [Aeromonas salmonicida subsp. achromogenes]TMX14938.1 hypothetical protein FGF02_07365 [Aeromonas salmonicida subsp. achromogenes]TMX20072.1 hypothetical protein FGF00_07990 [Aeromonas salmonicida subsp. achromogenes]